MHQKPRTNRLYVTRKKSREKDQTESKGERLSRFAVTNAFYETLVRSLCSHFIWSPKLQRCRSENQELSASSSPSVRPQPRHFTSSSQDSLFPAGLPICSAPQINRLRLTTEAVGKTVHGISGLVGLSLTSLFGTNTAISETNGISGTPSFSNTTQ